MRSEFRLHRGKKEVKEVDEVEEAKEGSIALLEAGWAGDS
jgi:hypothetical protein